MLSTLMWTQGMHVDVCRLYDLTTLRLYELRFYCPYTLGVLLV